MQCEDDGNSARLGTGRVNQELKGQESLPGVLGIRRTSRSLPAAGLLEWQATKDCAGNRTSMVALGQYPQVATAYPCIAPRLERSIRVAGPIGQWPEYCAQAAVFLRLAEDPPEPVPGLRVPLLDSGMSLRRFEPTSLRPLCDDGFFRQTGCAFPAALAPPTSVSFAERLVEPPDERPRAPRLDQLSDKVVVMRPAAGAPGARTRSAAGGRASEYQPAAVVMRKLRLKPRSMPAMPELGVRPCEFSLPTAAGGRSRAAQGGRP
jgi:hypothetical protein